LFKVNETDSVEVSYKSYLAIYGPDRKLKNCYWVTHTRDYRSKHPSEPTAVAHDCTSQLPVNALELVERCYVISMNVLTYYITHNMASVISDWVFKAE